MHQGISGTDTVLDMLQRNVICGMLYPRVPQVSQDVHSQQSGFDWADGCRHATQFLSADSTHERRPGCGSMKAELKLHALR